MLLQILNTSWRAGGKDSAARSIAVVCVTDSAASIRVSWSYIVRLSTMRIEEPVVSSANLSLAMNSASPHSNAV